MSERPLGRVSAPGPALLTGEQMAVADQMTIAAGTKGEVLMENAGAAVAALIQERWNPMATLVLCGPGNNGGDGFVVARCLQDAGWPVTVMSACEVKALRGDAAIHAERWQGVVEPLAPQVPEGVGLIVDGLFGAGLSRPLSGVTKDAVAAVNRFSASVVAIDIPSGVSGDSGEVLGTSAIEADVTVTFFRAKPGHYLLPGRQLVGDLVVSDIGIDAAILAGIGPECWLNGPDAWISCFPWRRPDSHKYHHGHLVIGAGDTMTGAACLAARAAQRAGAGLVTLAGARSVFSMLALAGPSTLLAAVENAEDLANLLADQRINCILLGPGLGVGADTRAKVLACAAQDGMRGMVLDADALTSFQDDADLLFQSIPEKTVMTPHSGEFTRLFPDASKALSGGKLGRAREAAQRAGAVIVLKGYDSVVAAPDGRAIINANAPPWLATAGSGDVLAGFIAALMAQGMPTFEAAAAAVWLHGEAASLFGPGLIAEDLPDVLPEVLQHLAPYHSAV